MDLSTAMLQQKKGLDVEDTGDELLIYLAGKDTTFHVNSTATLVLRLCDGKHSGSDIVQLLTESYPEDESVGQDVLDILNNLLNNGLIDLV